MPPQNYKFEGWVGHDKSSAEGNMTWEEFEPKRWEETDVDIKITHCGMYVMSSPLRAGNVY